MIINFQKFSQDINNVWQLFNNMNDGLMITNENLEVIAVNPAFNRITGYSYEEVAGQNPRFLQSGKTQHDVYQDMWHCILEYGSWTGELINVRKDGEQFCSFITITHIKNDDNKPSYYIGMMRDITERRETEEKIIHLAYHDPLTQLPNRSLFTKELRRTIQETKGTDNVFPLFFLDLNDFKKINDTFGHQIGDQLLIQLADRLADIIGDDGITSRFGGDEFTVMLHPAKTKQRAEDKIAELLQAFEEPFICSGEQLFMTTSIGVSYYPEHGRDIHTLVKNADRAMYKSKGSKQNSVEVYNEWYEAEANDRFHLEHELRRALRLDQLEVFYQLQVDVTTGKPFGVEALVRWNHPDKGVIAPNIFLPLAKETGLIVAIDEWVISRACEQVQKWNEQGHQLMLSVNLSEQFYIRQHLVDKIKQLLEQTTFPAQSLCLEITEDMANVNIKQTEEKLKQLRSLGVNVSLDNFGTGFSSLNHLKDFPIDTLKIDQSFVRKMGESKESEAVVRLMIAMAKSLNYKVIAQGVETEEQLSFIQNEGCVHVQGYLFSEPLSANACETMLININKAKQHT